MTNEDALEELRLAFEHIQNAKHTADSSIAKTEIENLKISCNDTMDGLLTDIRNQRNTPKPK